MLDLLPETLAREALPTDEPLAALDGVTLARGGDRLLDGLSLSLNGTGVTALMGPNGAGKSLTLRVLAGLVTPDAGRVSLHPSALKRAALVFQKPVLLRRTVRGNLEHALKTYGVPRAERPLRVTCLLGLGKLEGMAERPARRLSGGEQQRLALVRALASDPKLLLLDEPTASLDPRATAMIEALVIRAAEKGAKTVLVTHDAGQARRLADDVAFLHQGRLVEHSTAKTFFDKPKSQEARDYLNGRLLV